MLKEIDIVAKRLAELIYPPQCLFCDDIVPYGGECGCCREVVEKLKLCGDDRIQNTDRDVGNLDGVISSFVYADEVAEAVARYKFHGKFDLYRPISQFMANDFIDITKSINIRIDYVSEVPSYRNKSGHSRLLAKGTAKRIGAPHNDVLIKIRGTLKQHDIGLAERSVNVKGAFAVKDGKDVRGRTVLICDDVVTSGNTLKECAGTLKRAGAKAVFAVTFCATK